MASKSFGNHGPEIPHLNKGEVADLRKDVDAAFEVFESRVESRLGWPKISRVVGGASVSLAAVPVEKEIVGSGFLQGQAQASLAIGAETSLLTFLANRPGILGNDLSVEIVDTGGGGLSVAVVVDKVTIDMGGAAPTANQVKGALDGDDDFLNLMTVTSGGAGAVAVTAEANLSGGTGHGISVFINGLGQSIVGAVTDTSIPLVVSDLTDAADGDTAVLQVLTNGLLSEPITVNIAA